MANQALEHYFQRMEKNELYLLHLAADLTINLPGVEIYHMKLSEKRNEKIQSLMIFHGDKKATISFEEVPYRWHLRGEHHLQNCYDDYFTYQEVIDNMETVLQDAQIKKERFIKFHSYLVKYTRNE
jgi:hypothetical protein